MRYSMNQERFDAIVVGAGMGGAACAYRLAKAGKKVLLIERGNYAGAKNMTGGRIYTHSLEMLMPDFRGKAPLERKVTAEKISILQGGQETTIGYAANPQKAQDESYTVLRSVFDRFLAGEAEKAGAMVVNKIQVDELVKEGGRVVGVRCGKDTVLCDVVILADGANSMLAEQSGFRKRTRPADMAVGVKEVYTFPKSNFIDDRFCLAPGEGLSQLFMGDISCGLMGGGFLYTNKTSVSVGVVVSLSHIGEADMTIDEMMNRLLSYPCVVNAIRGGKLVERSGHMVPEVGYRGISTLSGDGFMIVGDAAGFCVNIGYAVRGMDFAIASGIYAADAYIKAHEAGDYSASSLRRYDQMVENSFIGHDLKLYRKFPEFAGSNPRLFSTYPELINGIMHDTFMINGDGASSLSSKLMKRAKSVGLFTLIGDAIKGGRSL